MVQIARWIDLPDPGATMPAIDAIFFDASGTQAFTDAQARDAFRDRWLGRYFTHDPGLVHVALDGGGTVIGYLVGSLDDPAKAERFKDIGFFADFALLTDRYPAQLHVNLAPAARGSGVGGLLVEAFASQARRADAPGVHVVTGQGVRNVGFYTRLGFLERGSTGPANRRIVFLGRDLACHASV